MDKSFPAPVGRAADTLSEHETAANLVKRFGWIRWLGASIGSKIILPYLLLTFLVAGAGAYIVTQLVTSSLQERFNNQLLDAGRIVSTGMVRYESERLAVLRAIAGTEGVPQSLAAGDRQTLGEWVPQIIANSTTDAVELLDMQGREVYGWQQPLNHVSSQGEARSGADFSQLEEVQRVLSGYTDTLGNKRVLLSDTPQGLMIFSIGPVYQAERQVGAVMVGTYVHTMLLDLAGAAVARVTLYAPDGQVIDTTLGSGQEGVIESIEEAPGRYQTVLELLQAAPGQHVVVVDRADQEVPLQQVTVFGQHYTLAFGDWRLRDQSFGLFSVALPNNFITNAASTSRNVLSLIFSIASVAVFGVGLVVARRIIQPLRHLMWTAMAVTHGNLEQRTQIQREDEIGTLAQSFDVMTDNLVEQNRLLITQASELETILSSIADSVLVLDLKGNIIRSNPAARHILADILTEARPEMLHNLRLMVTEVAAFDEQPTLSQPTPYNPTQRYRVGHRHYSALAAPMKTPQGEILGAVIVLRDVTREAEVEDLQDSFVTTISHELRTPLTAIKGYSDLLLKVSATGLNERHVPLIETVNVNANRLLTHVNKLIDISEIQSGTLALQEQEFCFADMVSDVVGRWREQIEGRNLTLIVSIADAGVMIHGDPNRLGWAIENLLSNAYNYTEQGRIIVKADCPAGEVYLSIQDTGVGIAAVDQPYLFTRFFRARNNHDFTYNVDGVGLGLYIARSLVEQHGGHITVESQLHVGSTFTLVLPLNGTNTRASFLW